MSKRNLVERIKFAAMAGVGASSITRACKAKLKAACVGKKIDADHPDAVSYINSKFPDIPATGLDPLYEKAVALCTEKGIYTTYFLRKGLSIGSARARKIVDLMQAAGIIPKPGEPPVKLKIKVRPEQPEPVEPEPEPPKLKPRVINGKVKQTQNKKDEALQKLNTENGPHEIPENIEAFADMTLRKIIHQFGSDYAFLDWLKATKAIEEINEKRLKNATTKGDLIHKEIVKRGIIEPVETVFVNLLSDGARALATRVPAKAASGESTIDIENYISDYIGKFIKKAKADINKTLKGVG